MKNVSRNGKMRGIFLVSILIICTVAVLWRRFGVSNTKNPEQQQVRDSLYQQKRVLQYNSKVYSQAVRLADDGDIVMRLSKDSISDNGEKTKAVNSNYSEAGIIFREHDTIFVYYATTKAGNSNGQVFREPLWKFGHPENNRRLALYRIAIDSMATQRLLLLIQKVYNIVKSRNRLTDITSGITDYNSAFIAGSFRLAVNDTTLFQPSDITNINLSDIVHKSKKIKNWEY